ncbi:MAG: hypothetical protein PHV47_01795 [Candidatus Pacebacteria bacterium]|nr:hypothetical protein [Candidatus Paceibacterota bacterium]
MAAKQPEKKEAKVAKRKIGSKGYLGLAIILAMFLVFVGLCFLGAWWGLGGFLLMLIVWAVVWWNMLVPEDMFGTIVPPGTFKVLSLLGQPYKALSNIDEPKSSDETVPRRRLLGALYIFFWPFVKVQNAWKVDLDPRSLTGELNEVVDYLPGYVIPFQVVIQGLETVGSMELDFVFSFRYWTTNPLRRIKVRLWKTIVLEQVEAAIFNIAKKYDYYGSQEGQKVVSDEMVQAIRDQLPELAELLGGRLEIVGHAEAVASAEVNEASARERQAQAESRRIQTLAEGEAAATLIRAKAGKEATALSGKGRAAALRAEIEVVQAGGDSGKAVLVAEAARTSSVGLAMAANIIDLKGIGRGDGLTVRVEQK